MHRIFRCAAPLVASLTLVACASLPREPVQHHVADLINARRDATLPRPNDVADLIPELPSTPIGVEDAVRLAFFHNPRIRGEYARLGLGLADLEDARRLANPRLGYSHQRSSESGASSITHRLGLNVGGLLLRPVRTRLAKAELQGLQTAIAANLIELATQVEVAWYEAVGAYQIATMRDLVAQAAEHSALLAQRFHDAGNIDRLQLEREFAASTQARIDALAAETAALRARHRLSTLMGLNSTTDWNLPQQLAEPLAVDFDRDSLLALARQMRLDLATADQSVVIREDALAVARRWRWFGSLELGYEREREPYGESKRGPELSLELPLFDQGQGTIARAQARLERAGAERDATDLAMRNAVHQELDALQLAHRISERYRTSLVPHREVIVARTQERVNFMLVGVFELILARQQGYDAYQAYLESVRDYWVTRAHLRGAVGGRLPNDEATPAPSIGVEAILPPNATGSHTGHEHAPGQAREDDGHHAHGHEHEHEHEHGDQP